MNRKKCCKKKRLITSLFCWGLLVISLQTWSQSIFKVVETPRDPLFEICPGKHDNEKYYRIILANDSLYPVSTYPVIPSDIKIDTLKAIEELLALKGDKRIYVVPLMCYDPVRSQIYMGESKNYAIQVHALFIINQLIFGNNFSYASCPVLVSKKDNSEATISGEIIEEAFKSYGKWYKRIRKIGLSQVIARKMMPLDSSTVKWY
ncbi:hypothetical protein [Chitinophaga qingshengii]|uniref:Uncharacterized protein n=1 Tax=Chitinophaga qingshengii TaxID=1569794 RepID=A0ABR7TLF4_9BACT|nr:hypothetical protein [Chitinophaga qingshengii]MBC9931327.1 hypothetical protein [Chitinophaga qingshengii]